VSGECRADETSVDGVEFDRRRVAESDVTLKEAMKAFSVVQKGEEHKERKSRTLFSLTARR